MKVYLSALTIMSILCYMLYVIDKGRARRNQWRIKESFLLIAPIFLGAFGSILAMITIRHKTKHSNFWTINTLNLLWQTALTIFLTIKF